MILFHRLRHCAGSAVYNLYQYCLVVLLALTLQQYRARNELGVMGMLNRAVASAHWRQSPLLAAVAVRALHHSVVSGTGLLLLVWDFTSYFTADAGNRHRSADLLLASLYNNWQQNVAYLKLTSYRLSFNFHRYYYAFRSIMPRLLVK